MSHSTITSKGQTTVPIRVREALGLKAGDRVVYELIEGAAVIRLHPGASAVFGALRPPPGKSGVPFKKAREAARAHWVNATVRRSRA